LAIRTHGLTHISLAVKDPARSLRFYRAVLGVIPVYEAEDLVQAQTPGSFDILIFQRGESLSGTTSEGHHFGFRLTRRADFRGAVALIRRAGGTIEEQGKFVEQEPYVFFRDPDGYLVEIWYETPTPVDPPRRRAKAPSKRPDRREPTLH
jgi:catechol 2,3-dioxygenase-like lactoylglutathione lyase family enzyme